jgi:hypothetical protein
VPSEQRFILGHDWSKSVDGLRADTISPGNAETKAEVRKFMLETFYREAVVPAALGLSAGAGNLEVVHRELDMYLDSGFSMCAYHEESGKLVGCNLFTTWKRDPNYEVVEDVSMTLWHNTAAEIAMEENPKHPQVCS